MTHKTRDTKHKIGNPKSKTSDVRSTEFMAKFLDKPAQLRRQRLLEIVPLLAKGQRNEAVAWASTSETNMKMFTELIRHQDPVTPGHDLSKFPKLQDGMVSCNAAYCFELMVDQGVDIPSIVFVMIGNIASSVLSGHGESEDAAHTVLCAIKALEAAAKKGFDVSPGALSTMLHSENSKISVAASEALVATLTNRKSREKTIEVLCYDLTEIYLDKDQKYTRTRNILLVFKKAVHEGADITSAIPTLLDFSIYPKYLEWEKQPSLSDYVGSVLYYIFSNKKLLNKQLFDILFENLLAGAKNFSDDPTERKKCIIRALRSVDTDDEKMRDLIVRKIHEVLGSKEFMKETEENTVIYADTISGFGELLAALRDKETGGMLRGGPWG